MQRLVQGIHKAFRSNQAYAPCQKAQPTRDQEEFETTLGESVIPQRWSLKDFANTPLSQPIPGCLITDIPCRWHSMPAAISVEEQKESRSEGFAIPRGFVPGAVLGAGYAVFNTLHTFCSGRLGGKANGRSEYCPVTQYKRLQNSSAIIRSLSNLLPGSSYGGVNSSFSVLPKGLSGRRIDTTASAKELSLEASSSEEDDKVLAQREYQKAKDKVNCLADQLRDIDKDNLAADHFIAMRAWKNNDFASAAVLWERTVEKFATPMAAHRLGICYEHGYGVDQDYQRASEYYSLAISHNCSEAMFKQAMLQMNGLVEGDGEDSIDLIKRSADSGYAKAQTFLGSFYFHKENKTMAVKYFEKAAKQNDAEACYYMGICHEIGAGVCADDKIAAEYYKRAAEGGHADAQYNHAVFHEEGYGDVDCSQEKAVYWYNKSSKQGNSKARDRLQQLGCWNMAPSASLPAIGMHLSSTLSDLCTHEIMRTQSYNTLPKPRNTLPVSKGVAKALSRASSSSSVAGQPKFYVPTEGDGEDVLTFGDWSVDEELSSHSSSSLCLAERSDGFAVDFLNKNTSFSQEFPSYFDHTVNESWNSNSESRIIFT